MAKRKKKTTSEYVVANTFTINSPHEECVSVTGRRFNWGSRVPEGTRFTELPEGFPHMHEMAGGEKDAGHDEDRTDNGDA